MGSTSTKNQSSKTSVAASKQQIQLLGKDYERDIFSDSINLSGLHPPAASDSFYDDEEEQSYAEFVEMGRRNPNFKGTGRWKLVPNKRDQLLVVNLCSKSDVFYGQSIPVVTNLLEKYFCMNVVYKDYKNALDSRKSELTINELIYDLRTLRTSKSKKRSRSGVPKTIDVFSIFDALVDSAIEPYISIIALVDTQIGELDADDKDGLAQIVMGRACGDRVCCVSLKECSTLPCLLSVLIHECLHTLGFDHCNYWRCVMNAVVGEDQTIFMSPVNLRKFKLLHRIPHTDLHFLLNRYEAIKDALQLFSGDIFKDDLKWIQDKISLMRVDIN